MHCARFVIVFVHLLDSYFLHMQMLWARVWGNGLKRGERQQAYSLKKLVICLVSFPFYLTFVIGGIWFLNRSVSLLPSSTISCTLPSCFSGGISSLPLSVVRSFPPPSPLPSGVQRPDRRVQEGGAAVAGGTGQAHRGEVRPQPAQSAPDVRGLQGAAVSNKAFINSQLL